MPIANAPLEADSDNRRRHGDTARGYPAAEGQHCLTPRASTPTLRTVNEDKAFYASLGRRIEVCRTERQLTQAALGAALTPPVTRAAISNIEKGRQRVLSHTLCAIAEILGVELTRLAPVAPSASPRHAIDLKKTLESKLPREAAEKFSSHIASRATARRKRAS